MKVIWEPGDTAIVDDDMTAGPTAACYVEIIKEHPIKAMHYVKITDGLQGHNPVKGTCHWIETGYLNPC